MADFETPFANEGEKRQPTSTEKSLGHPCGPADRTLFNGLIHDVQAELGHLITFAGIAHDEEVHTKVREAIEALISAATGGGDTSQFLLVSQARARLPIFPEVDSADGKINVTSPAAGTIRIPSGVDFLHRGIFPVTTAETDFSTDASKTYHVRWSSASGYELKDLASGTYNAGALDEDDSTFDSAYDDMLIARVVTNSSNVATITNLANRARLTVNSVISPDAWRNSNANGAEGDFSMNFNWARTPTGRGFSLVSSIWDEGSSSHGDHDLFLKEYGGGAGVSDFPIDRYRTRFTVVADFTSTRTYNISLSA